MGLKIPFVGGAYGGRSESVNAERTLNFFLEVQGDKPTLVGTPGLTTRVTLPTGPLRGLHFFNGNIIAVAGSKVYSIDSNHVATEIGTILSSSRVSMANNGLQVLIVDGTTKGYYWDGATFAQITDADFYGGVTASFQDGYLLVVEPNSGRFRTSDLYTVTSWLPTDFATAEGMPDNLRGLLSDHREVWLGGIKSFEVYYNAGDPDFAFLRNESGFIEKGLAAAFSLAKHDNSLAWLAEDERGQGLVLTADGNYRPTIVSPVGLNWRWSQYTRIDDAFSFVYQLEGHEFYVLTFPTANATWVLDASTKQWHQWSSNLNDNALSRHRANCHTFAFGRHYVGDYASGKVYTLEPEVYTEDGAPIIRDRICQTLSDKEELISVNSVQILFEEGVGTGSGQGTDPQVSLRWSKNGARTWSNELFRSVGKIGEYAKRAIWRKLGVAYRWTLWLRVSDPVKWVIRDAVARVRGAEDSNAAQ